jgi:multiple sugar transport system permease protein
MFKMNYHRRKRILAIAFLLPAIAILMLLVVYPLARTFQLSFQNLRFFGVVPPGAEAFSLRNYQRLLNSPNFWSSLRLSGIYTVVATGLSFGIGLGTALLLHQKFRGQQIARVLILIIWPIPSVTIAVVFTWLFDSAFGVVNYLLRSANLISQNIMWFTTKWPAVIATIAATVWKGYPFFTLMFLAGLQTIPIELYEAAQVDGASALQRFRHITFPALRTVAAIATILNGLWVFRSFDFIYVMTGGGPARATETLPITLYREAFNYFNLSYASAIGVVTFLLCAIVIVLSMPLLRDEFYG